MERGGIWVGRAGRVSGLCWFLDFLCRFGPGQSLHRRDLLRLISAGNDFDEYRVFAREIEHAARNRDCRGIDSERFAGGVKTKGEIVAEPSTLGNSGLSPPRSRDTNASLMKPRQKLTRGNRSLRRVYTDGSGFSRGDHLRCDGNGIASISRNRAQRRDACVTRNGVHRNSSRTPIFPAAHHHTNGFDVFGSFVGWRTKL